MVDLANYIHNYIVGIRLNGETYWTAWNEEHDEYNIYQRNIIHGDFVKIKFVGDE